MDERKFKCKTCGKRFPRRQNLDTHMISHTGYKRYKCTLCPKKFAYGHEFKIHQNAHAGIRPYKCNLCDKSFLRISELKSHKNSTIHAGIKPWKCTKCKKKFSQHAHLQAHIRSHTGAKPFQCKLCPKTFTQSSHLNTHMLHHTGEKPHQCKICKLRYRLKTTLNSHMRTHTGDRPYKCPQCPKAFTQHTPLAEHIQKAHGNEKFPCSGCYKVFQTKQQLQRHERSHFGNFNYFCVFCGRGFNLRFLMMDHYRRHIHEKPHSCEYCDKSFYSSSELKRCEKRHKRYGQKKREKTKKEVKLPKSTLIPNCESISSDEEFLSDPDESLSPPQLTKEQEPVVSFKGLLAVAVVDKDVNENTVGIEKGKTTEMDENCNTNGADITNPTSPLSVGDEIEDSITASPPSLDLEGRPEDEEDGDIIDGDTNKEPDTEKTVSNPIQCQVCKKTFSFPAQLNGHIWVHQKTKRPTKRLTRTKKSLRSSLSRLVKIKTEPLETTADPSTPSPPKKTNVPTEQNNLAKVKMELNEKYTRMKNMKREFAIKTEILSGPKKKKERFTSIKLLEQQLKEKQRPFKCSQCQYSAVCPISLGLHKRLVHEGVQCHPCQFCWKSFPTANTLTWHVKREHKEEKKMTTDEDKTDQLSPVTPESTTD